METISKMKKQDFTTTIKTEKTPKEVFDAVNDVRGWWQGEIEGSTDKLNDEFTYRYEEVHYSKQRIVEFVPGKKVVWLVTDSNLNFISYKSEWTGTKISFEISEAGNKTELRFTHIGLEPEIECYDACSNAWGQLIQHSLLSFINTGKGTKVF